jgi:diaminopimelate decarboxylase
MELVREALASGYFREEDTAVIIHDLDALAAGLAGLRAAFPPDTLTAVAVKANPLPLLVGFLAGLGAGAEAASLPELRLALEAGVPPGRIVFDSPAKTMEELGLALELGIHINADNLDELARLAELTVRTGRVPLAGLRVNPQVGPGWIAATSVAGTYSKFGVPLARRRDILAAFAAHPWLTGLHVHVGSQGCPLDLLVAGTAAVYELAEAVNRELGPGRVGLFDLGGGLPAAYRDTDRPPAPREYVAALGARCPRLFSGAYRLVTEFGRVLHAPCAVAVSRVEYVKRQPGHRTVILHLGADAFVRECYHPKSWPHRAVLLDREGVEKGGKTAVWHLTGPLCFSGDFPIRRIRLPDVVPGDLVVIRDVGAYALAMWSRYNSRQMPRVIGRRGGRFVVLRERETVMDVVRFWKGTGDGESPSPVP